MDRKGHTPPVQPLSLPRALKHAELTHDHRQCERTAWLSRAPGVGPCPSTMTVSPSLETRPHPTDRPTSRPKHLPLTSWLADAPACGTRPHAARQSTPGTTASVPARDARCRGLDSRMSTREETTNGNSKGRSTAEVTDEA